ncbi:WD40-repeat-containing domain protein [Lactarius hatsudake]|nr:WD40-repeat-containing domain protein [Lactarius hatsudake]
MAYNPKTPTRHRSRSDVAKTPLTPSLLISGFNNVTISSPTKTGGNKSSKYSVADITNPFISRSRPVSPVKRATSGSINVTESLQRQASSGVIRKGGVESKLDVVSRDYVPPPKSEAKRSRSTPAMRDSRDRFITNREVTEVAATLDLVSLNPTTTSPGHTARLVAATGVPINKRVLAYHEAPPAASDTTLNQQRELARPLYARPGTLASSSGAVTNKSRKIATQPERVLDAPGMVDDFYLNLLSWSVLNNTYIWKADSGSVVLLTSPPVDFSNDGAFLGIGVGTGDVELWHAHILSSACGDGSIWHHDVRIARHKVMELVGHTDGELLASGGNDNVVNIWDGRVGDVNEGSRGVARWTKRNHTAAVKALAWCPWQPSLLASGGGTNDATVHVWNSTTGGRLHSLKMPAQVTSVQWSPHKKEFLTTHGYPSNAIMVHAYPSLDRVAEIRDAHDSRVLFSCVSPAGDMVCTGAGDENLKFWRIWEIPPVKKRKESKEGRSLTGSGILSLR